MTKITEGKRQVLPRPVIEAALDLWSQAGREHWIAVVGTSMFPLIRNGDRLLVQHGDVGVQRGDVVVFRRDAALIAHRVMKITFVESSRLLVTKGDNAGAFDAPIPDHQIVGKVLGIERDKKYMSLDTTAWKILGASIVYASLASARWFDWGSQLKQKFLGTQPSRVANYLRRIVQGAFRFSRQIMPAVATWDNLIVEAAEFTRAPISPQTRTIIAGFAATDLTRPINFQDADWDEVLDQISRNGLLGLAFRYLEEGVSRDLFPDEFHTRLQQAFRSNAIRHAILYRNIIQVLSRLIQTNIPFLVVKGPVLAHTVYPSVSLRTFSDLDLVVRECDWVPMHQWMIANGFHSKENLSQPPPKFAPLTVVYEMQYWHSTTQLLVEVHYDDLLNAGLASRDVAGFWQRAIPVEIEGIPIKTLSLEDQLIHLSAHAHYHGYTRMNWFSDLAFIIRDHAASLNWDQLLRAVRKEEAQVPVYFTFCYLQRLLGVGVPPEILAALKPDYLRRRLHEYYLPEERVLAWQPMARPDFSFYFLPLFKRLLPDWLVMGRRWDKLRCLFHLLFPPPAWLRNYYKLDATSGTAAHYFLHPLKLVFHYWGEIIFEIRNRLRPQADRGNLRSTQRSINSPEHRVGRVSELSR